MCLRNNSANFASYSYSTTWLARALPEGGELLGLELEAKHAKVRRDYGAEALHVLTIA